MQSDCRQRECMRNRLAHGVGRRHARVTNREIEHIFCTDFGLACCPICSDLADARFRCTVSITLLVYHAMSPLVSEVTRPGRTYNMPLLVSEATCLVRRNSALFCCLAVRCCFSFRDAHCNEVLALWHRCCVNCDTNCSKESLFATHAPRTQRKAHTDPCQCARCSL